MNERSPSVDDEEILARVSYAAQRKKGYADFFDWPDKPIKERGIVSDLLDAIEAAEGRRRIQTLNANELDPPDCIAINMAGDLVGYEVTELVDQPTVERIQDGFSDWKEWQPDEIRMKLKTILARKDAKHLQGGPYAKYVVVIHTDEPLLQHESVASLLRGSKFGPFQQIDEAFLLFSYAPGRESYPYICLEIF